MLRSIPYIILFLLLTELLASLWAISHWGLLNAIIWLFATKALAIAIFRRIGADLQVMARVRSKEQLAAIYGQTMRLPIAALLLLLPGFLSDVAGIVLLLFSIPMLLKMPSMSHVNATYSSDNEADNRAKDRQGVTIDGKYEHHD